MKETFTDNGVEFNFSHWRIEPPGHKLPCPTKSVSHIPAEGIFIGDNGLEMGLSPENPLVREEVVYRADNSRKAERRRRGGKRRR